MNPYNHFFSCMCFCTCRPSPKKPKLRSDSLLFPSPAQLQIIFPLWWSDCKTYTVVIAVTSLASIPDWKVLDFTDRGVKTLIFEEMAIMIIRWVEANSTRRLFREWGVTELFFEDVVEESSGEVWIRIPCHPSAYVIDWGNGQRSWLILISSMNEFLNKSTVNCWIYSRLRIFISAAMREQSNSPARKSCAQITFVYLPHSAPAASFQKNSFLLLLVLGGSFFGRLRSSPSAYIFRVQRCLRWFIDPLWNPAHIICFAQGAYLGTS